MKKSYEVNLPIPGFKTTTKQIKDTKHRAKWKREFGTLFVTGKKI